MPYYPRASDTSYFCPNCRAWFIRAKGPLSYACTVYHGPGSCCHYAERRVDPPPLEPAAQDRAARSSRSEG